MSTETHTDWLAATLLAVAFLATLLWTPAARTDTATLLVAGFVLQLVSGTIGMASGVLLNSLLLGTGMPPALASATRATTEIFTSLATGASHLKLGNVDKKLFAELVVPGAIGGCLGAYLLPRLPVTPARILVNAYLLAVGTAIVVKALRKSSEWKATQRGAGLLGLVGGFLDAVGGGGWRVVVASTLIANGNNPRLSIGSVNLAKFFVIIAESAAFTASLGLADWRIVAGLAAGGWLAAPLAAYLCKRIHARPLTVIVGSAVAVLSAKNLATLLGALQGI